MVCRHGEQPDVPKAHCCNYNYPEEGILLVLEAKVSEEGLHGGRTEELPEAGLGGKTHAHLGWMQSSPGAITLQSLEPTWCV